VAARQWGTFHATGPELLDRATLARRICGVFGVDAGRVVPTPTVDLDQVAARPLGVALRTERLAATGLARFREVDAGLRALRAAERGRT
jgi:dTDP-4-dehydrorhamnose reductase